jgi:oligosaccharide repeat unit polymerase
MAVLAYEYHLIGGIPILSEDIDQMRMELFGVAGQGNPAFDTLFVKVIHFFVEFAKYGVYFAFIILVQRRTKSRKVIAFSVLLLLIGTLAYVSQAGRTFVIEIVVMCAVLFHYLRRRIHFVQLGATVLFLFLVLGVAGSLRTQTGTSSSIVQQIRDGSGFPEGQFWDGIAFGYLTATESFEVFYRLKGDLQTTGRPSDGFLFYGFHRIIPRANIQEVAFNLYTGAFVTPTFMAEFYLDYGIAGVIFGCLALGMFYGWAYSRGGSQNTMYWILVRGMLITMIVFFPYVNLFSQQVNWIEDMVFLYFLARIVRSSGDALPAPGIRRTALSSGLIGPADAANL